MVEAANRQVTTTTSPGSPEDRLLQRIRCEYHEMPGLCLTVRQAARLWNLDTQTSEAALNVLVADGYLAKISEGRFVSAALSNRRRLGRRRSRSN
jgi:hypothetical protein